MSEQRRAHPESSSAWLTIIKEYLNSGLSKENFCKNKRVNLQTFKGWHSRLNPKKRPLQLNQNQKSNFIPVTVTPRTNYSGLSVELPNGIKLAISDVDFDGHQLQKLLRACCDVVNR